MPQKLTSSELAATTDSIETLNGDKISVSSQGGSIMVNGQATVTNSDIEGTNGVVHIIDGVLEDN